MNCFRCRWFDLQNMRSWYNAETKTTRFDLLGTCRRHAPQMLRNPETGQDWSGWPETDGEDYCGEWEKVVSGPAMSKMPGRSKKDLDRDEETMQMTTNRNAQRPKT